MGALSIDQLRLSHFRSHKLATLSVDPRPIAIYGPNGAGKTNILEALSLLSPGRGLRRAKAAELSRQPESLGWKISAVLTAQGEQHEIETSLEQSGSRSVSINGKSCSQIALGSLARVVWLVPVMDRLWVEGAEGRRRFLDRLTLSFHPAHAQLSSKYERAMRERNRLIKDGVTDPAWYQAIEAQMAESGAMIEQNRVSAVARLIVAQDGAMTEFPFADLTLIGPDASQIIVDAQSLSTAYAEYRSRDLAAGRTLIGPHRTDLNAIYRAKSLAAAQCSTGEQKALLVSLILSNARALSEDIQAPPIILLDEVGAHLDADRRHALFDEICSLGAQAWMTATDLDLYDGLGGRASYLEVSENAGHSQIKEVSP